MTVYAISPLNVWPDIEALVRAWLVANIPGVNVRTETNASFASVTPDTSMTLPLVLIQRVPGGSVDANDSTEDAAVDVQCFATSRTDMWALYAKSHAWMLRLVGHGNTFGTVDNVTVSNGVGEVNYANPDVRRCVTTYHLSTRPSTVLT